MIVAMDVVSLCAGGSPSNPIHRVRLVRYTVAHDATHFSDTPFKDTRLYIYGSDSYRGKGINK